MPDGPELEGVSLSKNAFLFANTPRCAAKWRTQGQSNEVQPVQSRIRIALSGKAICRAEYANLFGPTYMGHSGICLGYAYLATLT